MVNIAIFASGTGSNARKIMEYFQNHEQIRVGLVVSNKSTAGVLSIAEAFGVPTLVVHRTSFYEGTEFLRELEQRQIDWLILAGFLWLVPSYLIERYPSRIINIHPALLPAFGGKGMYGMHVHEAVRAAGVAETGITIHTIDEQYDRGVILFQAKVLVLEEDTAQEIASKVLALEHRYFPTVVEQTIQKAQG
jgi:phosphoribosylglycinamide formyltransferase-1